jgi:hypothetical protein
MIEYNKQEKLTNEDFVEKAIQLYKLYCELYNDDLVGVSSTNIHLNEERYFDLFSQEESTMKLCNENIIYSIVKDEIKFITLKKLTIDMVKDKI